MKKTGSINVATDLIIPEEGFASVVSKFQSIILNSSDLSAETTFALEVGDETSWDVAQVSGTDITDTLVSGVAKIKTFEIDPNLFWRIKFTAGSTGTVTYKVFE